MNGRDKRRWGVVWMVVLDGFLAIIELTIDGHSLLSFGDLSYPPHALAARIIAVVRSLLSLVLLFMLGWVALEWLFEKDA